MDSEQLTLSDNEINSENLDNKNIGLLNNQSNNDSENDSDELNNISDDSDDQNDLDDLDELDNPNHSDDLDDSDDSNNSDDSDDLDDSKSELINYQSQINQDDTKNTLKKVPNEKRITNPVLTKYEFNRIYGLRLKHITSGSKLLISVSDKLSIEQQVQKEIYEKKTPFIIRRNLPNNYYEDWKLNELFIPDVLFI